MVDLHFQQAILQMLFQLKCFSQQIDFLHAKNQHMSDETYLSHSGHRRQVDSNDDTDGCKYLKETQCSVNQSS